MRSILAALVLATTTLLLAAPASAQQIRKLTAAEVAGGTGAGTTNGGDLADTLSTAAIPVTAQWVGGTIKFDFTITPGSTTQMNVSCKDGPTSTPTHWIPWCSDSGTASCIKQVLNFPDVTTATGIPTSSVVVTIRDYFTICVFDDPDDGTGTIVVTATIRR
jgi:hypothetical protein